MTKTLLLFKKQSEDYEKVFKSNGYRVLFIEPLGFNFINTDILKKKLAMPEYNGMILTSPRAIEAVKENWGQELRNLWQDKPIYVVGASSGRTVMKNLGLRALGTEAGNSANLAQIILANHKELCNILFPCGNLSLDTICSTLNSSKINVDSLIVYETCENKELNCKLSNIDQEIALSGLVFFSPSGCSYVNKEFHSAFPNFLKLPSFAIGESTLKRLKDSGMVAAGVADEPNAKEVLKCIDTYFSKQVSQQKQI